MRTFYAPLDIRARNCMKYEECRQLENKRIDNYYTRFHNLVSQLDVKSLSTHQVSKFVLGLQKGYKKILPQYPDMSTFKNVINRGIRMGQDPFSGSANSSGQRTSKPAENSGEH